MLSPRAALQKATITTTTAAAALLPPEKSRALISVLREKAVGGWRTEQRNAPSGTINKITAGKRIIRKGVENDDDGYRAEVTFPTVGYQTQLVRLPWEVTLDALQTNIDPNAEAKIEGEMMDSWSLDLEDLGFNGDTAAGAGPDQPFLTIDDGWLKQIAAGPGARQIDGGAINAGVMTKSHLFAARHALPNRASGRGDLVWVMSPNRFVVWQEYLTDRNTAAGDAALNAGGDAVARPLGYPVVMPPSFPDGVILLTPRSNLVRVITLDIERYTVRPGQDWQLTTARKIGSVFFMKLDHIVEDTDLAVRVYGMV